MAQVQKNISSFVVDLTFLFCLIPHMTTGQDVVGQHNAQSKIALQLLRLIRELQTYGIRLMHASQDLKNSIYICDSLNEFLLNRGVIRLQPVTLISDATQSYLYKINMVVLEVTTISYRWRGTVS
jgi:plasmid replication initiation protein